MLVREKLQRSVFKKEKGIVGFWQSVSFLKKTVYFFSATPLTFSLWELEKH